ncbi:MAG: phosphoribosylamine--glycine ligase [Bacteroidales bacterium]|nr:phosphoribosylamine--glycine ligase [Bacteroidales bacterium]
MNILLLGSGGRESALARVIANGKRTEHFFISSGNPGMEKWGKCITLNGFEEIGLFCQKEKIDILVVGPEQPLVDGIGDYFSEQESLKNIIVVGPNKVAAQLEGSKDFSKDFMFRYNIPTAKYRTFTKDNIQDGKDFLRTLQAPYVLKADGLAAGKGVLILNSLSEAEEELENMLKNEKFGKASAKVVIEEYLSGVECSVFVLTDGDNYILLPEAKDYKRVGEDDTGLNTGGMGSISPVPFCDKTFMQKVEQRIIQPTIEGLKKDKIHYQGFIFFGLMNVKGDPYVIEYNVRMGDPESESVFARFDSDIVEAYELMGKKELDKYQLKISEKTATTVMLCSGGYPENYEKGKIINGLDKVQNAIVYHAGTKKDNENNILTNGGRVLAVTCLADDMQQALNLCYENINKISFDKMYYRKDIGKDLMK